LGYMFVGGIHSDYRHLVDTLSRLGCYSSSVHVFLETPLLPGHKHLLSILNNEVFKHGCDGLHVTMIDPGNPVNVLNNIRSLARGSRKRIVVVIGSGLDRLDTLILLGIVLSGRGFKLVIPYGTDYIEIDIAQPQLIMGYRKLPMRLEKLLAMIISRGGVGIDELTRKTGLKRTSLMKYLGQLRKMDLVSIDDKEGKVYPTIQAYLVG